MKYKTNKVNYNFIFNFLGLLTTFQVMIDTVLPQKAYSVTSAKRAVESSAPASSDTKNKSERIRLALEERISYNSENQTNASINGIYGITREWFTTASLQYGRDPLTIPKKSEQTYTGAAQVGYNTGMWGFDAGYSQSVASVSKLISRTFQGGATFAYYDGFFGDKKQDRLDLLKASNKQTYQSEARENDPLFWCRVGVNSTSLNSKYLVTEGTASQSGIRQLGVSLDYYAPLSSQLVYSGGGALYGYSVEPARKSTELYQSSSEEVFLIGSQFAGLPGASVWNELSWQITTHDAFMPRIQSTLIQATRQWSVGGNLTWRRKVIPHLYITPTYGLSVLGSYVTSSFQISFFQDF